MEILIMQVFVSLLLGAGSVLLFLFTAKQRDFEHADRLALLPVDEDDVDEDDELEEGQTQAEGEALTQRNRR